MQKKNQKKIMIGFYKRKAIFFLLIFLFIGTGLGLKKFNSFSADSVDSVSYVDTNSSEISVKILNNGDVTVDGKPSKKVDLLNDYDELRLLVLDSSGQYFSEIKITLTLPKDNAIDVSHEVLAIHGVGESKSEIIGTNQIVYTVEDVSPQATITIVAKMPKGTINPSFFREILKSLTNIKQGIWIISAILLPLITFLIMLSFIAAQRRSQKIDIPEKESSMPPMALPPAVVGALYSQKVGPREVAATLVDLAIRGDIVIVDRERGFEFGKNRFDQRLLGYEKILLSKIFRKSIYSDKSEIEQRINNHFYSKKISLVTAGIYSLATRLGYFKLNPQKLHAKYRLVGIISFALALAGFVLSLMIFTDPAYIVFFWVGMMISSLVISVVAGSLPIRTVIGQEVLSNWIGFKKFLSNPEEFPFSENNQEVFQKYLPYAIVLECEAAWARRFSRHSFVIPDWFLTEKIGLGLEDFCLSLFPIVSYVGRSLAALKEPGFE